MIKFPYAEFTIAAVMLLLLLPNISNSSKQTGHCVYSLQCANNDLGYLREEKQTLQLPEALYTRKGIKSECSLIMKE